MLWAIRTRLNHHMPSRACSSREACLHGQEDSLAPGGRGLFCAIKHWKSGGR